VDLRSANVLKLSTAPLTATVEVPADFSTLVKDVQMKTLLGGRWSEITSCVIGLLEGLLLARVNNHAIKSEIFTTGAAPKDEAGKTLHSKTGHSKLTLV